MSAVVMTPEEFLKYVMEFGDCRLKDKARDNFIRERYAAYVRAYRVPTYSEAFGFWTERHLYDAIRRGLEDKDLGKPMVQVPELL